MEDSEDDSADRSEGNSGGESAVSREAAGARRRAPHAPEAKLRPKRQNHGDLGVEEARRLKHLARRRELAQQVSTLERPLLPAQAMMECTMVQSYNVLNYLST